MGKKNVLKFPVKGRRPAPSINDYSEFQNINGLHSFKDQVPAAYVDYMARKRKGGRVAFFNFRLAKEMGLIPEDHPHTINPKLSAKILETFSITIINEYDLLNKRKFPAAEILPNTYMATRYLQLQHPDKRGTTSGDGRSVWNGEFAGKERWWDVSSCGVGATCLSPATAIHKKFFKTGDKFVSYGCGYADLEDGLGAALFSEILHHNGVQTERTLAVIEYEKGLAVNVRAGDNLLRPSHFFCQLKQGNFEATKSLFEYYREREMRNRRWPKLKSFDEDCDFFMQKITKNFARMTAIFEREYIFCWMDWDGDNILMDGGIIDYGSVRQFGLYHQEYRYDDVQRFSTNISEQKLKARYIVQTFAQMVDFLRTGKKKNLRQFAKNEYLKKFDEIYQWEKDRLLLAKMGLREELVHLVLEKKRDLVHKFDEVFSYFEKAKSKKGIVKVADGVNCNALFSMRDILRELPGHYHHDYQRLGPHLFMNILRSKYCSKNEMEVTPYRRRKIQLFQQYYAQIMEYAARRGGQDLQDLYEEVMDRSALINRYDRITGDAVVMLSYKMKEKKKLIHFKDFHAIFDELVFEQILIPEEKKNFQLQTLSHKKKERRFFQSMVQVIQSHRYGI